MTARDEIHTLREKAELDRLAMEIAVDMEVHAAIGTTTRAKGDEISRRISAFLVSRTSNEALVKALEWRELTDKIFAATTIMGSYKSYDINLSMGIAKPMWRRPEGKTFTATSIEAAKAAAQSDYESRIRSALSVGRGEEGWRDISTAPKDKDVLLAVIHDEDGEQWSYVSQGRWIDGEPDQIDQPGHDAGFVDCDYQCFFPGRSFGAERSHYEAKQPTHWMPLPAPPAPSPQGRDV